MFLVGKLSATMDAVAPRASVAAELKKAIDNVNENDVRSTKPKDYSIDENAFVDGLWGREENHDNSNVKNVENTDIESVENVVENGIIEETVDNDTGVPGEYTEEILWSIFPHILVRKCGKGYFGTRIKQSDIRIDNYELKINPNNESFYLMHPDGRYVQFENMKNSTLQDAKLVMSNRSMYHAKKLSAFMQQKLLDKTNRQFETASAAGYKLEWIVSDKTAVEQLTQFFAEQNIDIIVTYYPEKE